MDGKTAYADIIGHADNWSVSSQYIFALRGRDTGSICLVEKAARAQ